MIKITEDKLKSGIVKAIEQFKWDCDYILNNCKSPNTSRINVLSENKESALGKISMIFWLCDYDEELEEFGRCNIQIIHSMFNHVFDEIMYKNK